MILTYFVCVYVAVSVFLVRFGANEQCSFDDVDYRLDTKRDAAIAKQI